VHAVPVLAFIGCEGFVMRVRAGELRHTIAIQEQADTSDGMGGFTTAWSDVSGMGSVRAMILPVRGAERMEAVKLELERTVKIVIRYVSGITAKNRVYWADEGRTFNIVDVANTDHKKRWLEILATEAV
jgi:SPP1 family predicted phage head-tail adaptor